MMLYDIHCHMLPGLDDGAFSMDESVLMAEMAASHHERAVVCTPHWLPDSDYDLRTLLGVLQKTGSVLRERGIRLKLIAGQEVFLDENYRETVGLLESSRLLTINRSVYPLVEFSPYVSEHLVYSSIGYLTARGFIPIIAHPERYRFVIEDPSVLKRMKNLGAFLQMNKGSVSGFFGGSVRRTAEYMLSARLADFAASDAHSPYRRTPPLNELHEWLSVNCSMRYADFLLCENPLRVLKNERIYSYT